jgi:uracil-DNA glycosylase
MAIFKMIDLENKLNPTWRRLLKPEFDKNYFYELRQSVEAAYSNEIIYPAKENIFRAFDLTPVPEVKVVIIGQDPYHGENQANGLCFSVKEDCKIPPSLRNIFKELHNDIGKPLPSHGNIEHWAKQGVLMINAVLTVKAGEAASHRKIGWELFTQAVIEQISEHNKNLVFILWGNDAQKKEKYIQSKEQHLILKSVHPSPLSAGRGFFGNKHFSKTNDFLKKTGQRIIIW